MSEHEMLIVTIQEDGTEFDVYAVQDLRAPKESAVQVTDDFTCRAMVMEQPDTKPMTGYFVGRPMEADELARYEEAKVRRGG